MMSAAVLVTTNKSRGMKEWKIPPVNCEDPENKTHVCNPREKTTCLADNAVSWNKQICQWNNNKKKKITKTEQDELVWLNAAVDMERHHFCLIKTPNHQQSTPSTGSLHMKWRNLDCVRREYVSVCAAAKAHVTQEGMFFWFLFFIFPPGEQ